MKKVLLALFGAAALCSTLVAAPMSPAGAADLADLSVTVESLPVKVAPPGADVLYRVRVTNTGSVPMINVRLTDTITDGTLYAAPAGCTKSGNTYTCDYGSVAPGQTIVVDSKNQTRTTVGITSNTARLQVLAPPFDQNASNDSFTRNTEVVSSLDGAFAFLQATKSLTYQQHVLTAPAGINGVITQLSTVSSNGAMCGANACAPDALHNEYSPDPNYQATDPTRPMKLTVVQAQQACNGGGTDCLDLYWRHDASMIPELLPKCSVAGVAQPSPCNNRVYNGTQGRRFTEVLLLSNDPDLLSPLGLGRR